MSDNDCECKTWARDFAGSLLYEHHANCRHFDPAGDALRLIRRLVDGMDDWAADEDNEIHPDAWEAYLDARTVLGDPVRDDPTAPPGAAPAAVDGRSPSARAPGVESRESGSCQSAAGRGGFSRRSE